MNRKTSSIAAETKTRYGARTSSRMIYGTAFQCIQMIDSRLNLIQNNPQFLHPRHALVTAADCENALARGVAVCRERPTQDDNSLT